MRRCAHTHSSSSSSHLQQTTDYGDHAALKQHRRGNNLLESLPLTCSHNMASRAPCTVKTHRKHHWPIPLSSLHPRKVTAGVAPSPAGMLKPRQAESMIHMWPPSPQAERGTANLPVAAAHTHMHTQLTHSYTCRASAALAVYVDEKMLVL